MKKSIFLVRHAQALSRGSWTDDDSLRPLSKKGERQAARLVEVLGDRRIVRVLSSPAVRCQATVIPLARELDIPLELDYGLQEGADFDLTKQLLVEVADDPGDVVLCSHGDIIPEVLWHLGSLGTKVHDEQRWAKGSTWALEWDGERFTDARYSPPPH